MIMVTFENNRTQTTRSPPARYGTARSTYYSVAVVVQMIKKKQNIFLTGLLKLGSR